VGLAISEVQGSAGTFPRFTEMNSHSETTVVVIGGGIAGSEAAWQAARCGADVILYEMRPAVTTEAHTTDLLAEIVGDNSFGVWLSTKAQGLLKHELRQLQSLVLDTADKSALPESYELLVDRQQMAGTLTEALIGHPHIEIRRQQVTELPRSGAVVVASGPLTSQLLARALYRAIGQPYRFFYQSSVPIVRLHNIDDRALVPGSPYDPQRDSSERNCLLDEAGFEAFCAALVDAETTVPDEANPEELLDRYLPVEIMARRDQYLLRRGPMSTGRLVDPASRQRPTALVRMVPENADGDLWRLAGMGTGLIPDEQQRVFGQLPGLEGLEIVRPGRAVRSVFVPAPAILTRSGRVANGGGLFLAGQLLGTANYVEAAATGWLAGVNAARWAYRRQPVLIPAETMFGALMRRLTESDVSSYCLEPVNFGMLPVERGDAGLSKEERRQLQAQKSEVAMAELLTELILLQ